MKRSFKIVFLVMSFIAVTLFTAAQQLTLALNYNTSTPIGSSLKEYVSKTSFRGLQGSVLYNLDRSFRIGLQVAYNDFYQKYARQVYKTTDGADISTVLSNTFQNTPILVKGEYSLTRSGLLRPYIGLGAGMAIINYDQFLGEFEYNKSYIKAAFTGDLGLLIPLGKGGNYGARISTSYNFTPFNEENIRNIDTWNVQAGIVIPLKENR